MRLKVTLQKNVLILFIQLFICQLVSAQTENKLFPLIPDSIRFERHIFNQSIQGSLLPEKVTLEQHITPFTDYRYKLGLFNSDKSKNKRYSFSQNHFHTDLPGIGSVNHYDNTFKWIPGDKTRIDFNAGLVIQTSFMDPNIPVYKFSLGTSIMHSFNDWLTAYMYSRYISPPVNRHEGFSDAVFFNNPVFLHNEVGAGINAKYKSTNIDFQIFSIYGAEHNEVKPVHSKIRIGF